MRKNSQAKSWSKKRLAQLKRQKMSHEEALVTVLSEAKKHGLVKNPSEVAELKDELEDAEEVARGFHGRENLEAFEVEETEVYRENLAFLGNMLDVEVFIEARADEGLITLPFEEVMLGASSDRKQLYLTGDTSLPDEWLEEANPVGYQKDKVIIGYVYSISYFADKHHLTGPKQQKKGSEYIHAFAEQTFKAPARYEGVWKLEEKIQAGRLPQLIYNRLSGGLELVGGGYEIRDEGIWD